MVKRIFIGLGVFILVGGLGFIAYAWRPAMTLIAPPDKSAFSKDLIDQGRKLAGAGNCASCHTTEGGAAYVGSRAVRTGFGIIYSTNITPDPETGIGRWSEAAFIRAMRQGVSRDGRHLFPAFPYTQYTKVKDEDLKALYAYFMTRDPVAAELPENTVPFPLNIRMLQAGWKLLFFDEGVYQPDTAKGETWNRGAYLAEGLGHCSACHSPRNILGAERTGDKRYAGAVIDGWYAPALTDTNGAPLPWTENELFSYLRTGATALHGIAGGSMSHVVHDGLSRLPESDIRALATYFSELGNAPSEIGADEVTAAMTAQVNRPLSPRHEKGARLYEAACASCHYNAPGSPKVLRPELSLNTAVTGPDPTTFIRFVLDGVGKAEGHAALFMHGYKHALGDREIAAIGSYLRTTYSTKTTPVPAWQNLETKVRDIRERMETTQ